MLLNININNKIIQLCFQNFKWLSVLSNTFKPIQLFIWFKLVSISILKQLIKLGIFTIYTRNLYFDYVCLIPLNFKF